MNELWAIVEKIVSKQKLKMMEHDLYDLCT